LTNDESGEFTPEQLAKLDSLDVIALLRRTSGDPNFYWRVREAVLNRAADEIKRLLESEAKAERIALHWQTEAQKRAAEPTAEPSGVQGAGDEGGTRAPLPECICPTCGLRHGGSHLDGGF